jgi:MFS family permease
MTSFSRAKALFSVYFIASIDNIGFCMVFVLFPPLLLNPEYGFTAQNPSFIGKLIAMGALYAAFPIGQFIGSPVIGELADRFGRKKLFLGTIFCTILGYLLTGFSMSLKSIILIFFARFLTGLFSGNQGLCNASIADLSPNEKERARNYGILTVVWGISFPIALLLGGIFSDPSLSSHFSPTIPFYIAAFFTILNLVAVIFFFPETFDRIEKRVHLDLIKGFHNIKEALLMRSTRKFFLLMLVWTLGWGYSITWYGAYAIQRFGVSQQIITLGLLIQGILWTLGGAMLKPILLKRMENLPIARLSYLLTTLLLVVTAFMPTFATFIIAYSLSALMGAVSLSSTFNLISISSHTTAQGKAMGITQSVNSLGFFLVPILGAFTGTVSIYTFYPIAALFLGIGYVILKRKS